LKKANPSQDGDAKPPFLNVILQESGAAEALGNLAALSSQVSLR
jgi:hypothetical protein